MTLVWFRVGCCAVLSLENYVLRNAQDYSLVIVIKCHLVDIYSKP